MTICLFSARSQNTWTFRDAKIVQNNETVLVVEYKAMSDGKIKTLTAQKSAIIGWSVSE
jgi:hypothetical protein